MKCRALYIVFICLGIPAFLLGQYERPGSASAQFLKIGVSPRAAAMSDAYIAIARGAEGTYYNPAVLARSDGLDLAATHTSWFAGIRHTFAAGSWNAGRIGAFGVSVTSFGTDEMKVRTPLQPAGTGETFYVNNYRAGLTYSRVLTDHVSFGGTVNVISMNLYQDLSQLAYAADIAALYITNFREFQFGMKIANFGSSVTFVNEQYPLPLNFTFGLAMNAIESPFQEVKVSMAAMKPNDGQTLAQFGVEWGFQDVVFARGGYRLNHDIATYSLGGGVKVPVAGSQWDLDYSVSAYGELGLVHRVGIRMGL